MLNLLVGLMLSAYTVFNMVVVSVILFLTAGILLWIDNSNTLKDGFKVSLSFIIPSLGLLEIILGALMPSRFVDNWCLLVILLLMAFEGILLVATHNTSLNKG